MIIGGCQVNMQGLLATTAGFMLFSVKMSVNWKMGTTVCMTYPGENKSHMQHADYIHEFPFIFGEELISLAY